MIAARVVLAVCDRFGCTPREARRQDAGVLALLEIEDRMGWRRREEVSYDG